MGDTSLIFNLIAIDKATGILGKVTKGFGAFGLAVGVAAVGAGIKFVGMAADFQTGMTRLVTGAGESQAALGSVSDGVLRLAGQVGESADDLAHALYVIESGGQHGADGLLVLQAAAEGAKAEQASLETVADAVTSALQDYHLKASDAAEVTSELVAATGAGKTSFEQLAGSLSAVLPIASSANISLADITGSLASMTVHGMSAEQASQNLADTIKHLVAPTSVQTAEIAQLGLSSQDLAGMLGTKGLAGTLQFLSQTILQHMGPSGRVLLDSFNKSKDAAHDVTVMISKMSPEASKLAKAYQAGSVSLGDFRKELKEMPADQANLLRQFTSLQGTASGFNDLLKSGAPASQSYQDALRRVTGDATGLNVALMLTGENTDYTNAAIAKIAGTTTEAGGHVKGWSEVQDTFNQRLSETKGAAEALGIRIGNALLPKVQDMLGVVKDSVDWFGRHKTVAKDLAETIGILGGAVLAYKTYTLLAGAATVAWGIATSGAAVAQWALNVAMDANPITLVILAVIGLGEGINLLAQHSAGFRDFWKGIWGDIKHIAGDAWAWLGKGWDGLVWAFHQPLDALVGYFKFIFNRIIDVANGVVAGVNLVITGLDYLPGVDIPHLSMLPKLAAGGTATTGGLAVVGERGAEVVRLGRGDTVFPHGTGPAMSGGGGGGRQELRLVVDGAGSDTQFEQFLMYLIRKYVRVVGGTDDKSVQRTFGKVA